MTAYPSHTSGQLKRTTMEKENEKGNALYRFGRHTGYNDATDKAVEWIDRHAQDYVRVHAISGEITFFRLEMINDFRQYMKNNRL